MASIQSTHSAISHWPTVNKVAFWTEDQLTMKIVKIALSVILIPLAIMADLVNKTIIYIGQKKDKTAEQTATTQKITWGTWLKNSLGLEKVTNIWTNHKPIIIIIAGLGLAALALYQFKSIKGFVSGYKEPTKNINLNAGNTTIPGNANIIRLEFPPETLNTSASSESDLNVSKTNITAGKTKIIAYLGLAVLALYQFKSVKDFVHLKNHNFYMFCTTNQFLVSLGVYLGFIHTVNSPK
jgi:hypothetical protein